MNPQNTPPSTSRSRSPEKASRKTSKPEHTLPLSEQEQKNLKGLIEAIESTGLDEFMEYIRSPWRMLWPNFVAGIARGVGALVWAAAIIALIGWILSKLISLPLIGQSLEPYIQDMQNEITKYTEATNYRPHFETMERLLREIRDQNIQQNPSYSDPHQQ